MKLDGLTIPIASGGMRTAGNQNGVAFDGSPLPSRHFLKRQWQFTTPPLSEADYNLIEAILQKRGQMWFHESEDEYSTKGVGPLSGTVYGGEYTRQYGSVGEDPVYDQNGEVDAKSVISGHFSKAYTNDVAANIATGGDTNGDTTGFALLGAGAIAYSTAKAWKGVGSIKVTPGDVDQGVTITPTTLTLTVAYLATFYILPTESSNVRVRYKGDGSAEGWNDFAVEAGRWNRVVVSDILAAPNANPKIDIAVDEVGVFYIDGVLTIDSWADYATPPWAEATLVNNTMQVPPSIVTSALDMTISAWIKMDWTDVNKARSYLLQLGSSNYIRRSVNSTDLVFAFTDANGVYAEYTENSLFTDQAWHHIAAVFRRYPDSGENGTEVWVDGSLEYNSTARIAPDFSALTSIDIGSSGTDDWLGAVDDLMFFPAAINAEMIAALQTTPWAGLPKLRATGDFIYGASVDVVPKITSEPYRPSMRDGTFAPNSRSISFELAEA